MYYHQGKWYSSFLGIIDHPEGISTDLQILTVLSGSQGNGGHVSMFLEGPEPLDAFRVTTLKLELTAVQGHPLPIIDIKRVQKSNLRGQLYDDDLGKIGSPDKLLNKHHACYKIDSTQSKKLLDAVDRFKAKSEDGRASRYRYQHLGGNKARMASRPGTRRVNCADFVIKVLEEAGIAELGYKYLSTPYRVATQHKQL